MPNEIKPSNLTDQNRNQEIIRFSLKRFGLFAGFLILLTGINYFFGQGSNRLIGSATGLSACDCQRQVAIDTSMKEHGLLCEGVSQTLVSTIHNERTKQVRCTVDPNIHKQPASIVEASVAPPFFIAVLTKTQLAPGEDFAIELGFSPAELGQHVSSVAMKIEYKNQAQDIRFDLEGWALQGQEWDEMPENPPCVESSDSLFEEYLAAENLTVLDYQLNENTLEASKARKAGMPEDEFRSPYLLELRNYPQRAGCIENELASVMDAYLELAHPSSGLIRHAALHLQYEIGDSYQPFGPAQDPHEFDMAIDSLCVDLLECQEACQTI